MSISYSDKIMPIAYAYAIFLGKITITWTVFLFCTGSQLEPVLVLRP